MNMPAWDAQRCDDCNPTGILANMRQQTRHGRDWMATLHYEAPHGEGHQFSVNVNSE